MAADPSEHVAQAKLLIAERRYQDAVRALRRALVSRPDHVEARLLLGTALLALERYDEVRAEMVALSRKAPADARVHRVLGEAFLRGGKVEKAVAALHRALELDPDDDAARELLAEAGEEVPARSRTLERWFDPEQVATVQTNAPEFVEDVTGPHAAMPELRGVPTSVVVDPAFQRAIDDAGSADITLPAPAERPPARRRAATLLGVQAPVALPPAESSRRPKATALGMPPVGAAPAESSRRPKATALGMPPVGAAPAESSRHPKATVLGMPPVGAAPAKPSSVAAAPQSVPDLSLPRPAPAVSSATPAPEPSTTEIELPRERASSTPSRHAAPGQRPPGPRPPVSGGAPPRAAPASPRQPPGPAAARRDITERLELEQLEPVESSAPVELDASDLRDDSTGELPRPPPSPPRVVAGPSAAPAARVAPPLRAPAAPPVMSSAIAAPPRGFATPGPSFPMPSAPAPGADAAGEPYAAQPPFGASTGRPPAYVRGAPDGFDLDSSNEDRMNARSASTPEKSRAVLALVAVALVAAFVVLGLGVLGVRALLAGRRADALAAQVASAEADGRPATLAAAIAALDSAHEDDAESVALLLRLEATGVLEQNRDAARANGLLAQLEGEDAQLPNAQLGRAYLLLARGEIDGARRAATTLSAGDDLASEAARVRALAALAAGDLTRAVGEARVSAAAAPGAPRSAVLLATTLARSGDAVSALSTLDGIANGALSPAVRLARARVLLARDHAGDREAASAEAAAVLGPLAATSTAFERAGAHLVAAELAVAAGDLTRAASEVRQAQPAPADEAFGLARADVLVTTGAAAEARAVLATLPPTSSDPPRRAYVTATVALGMNDLDAAERASTELGQGGEVDLLRGRIAEARGRSDDAKTFYQRVPLDDAAMPAARTRLAAILLAAGRVRQASEALAPASERLPMDIDITLLTARIRLELRDVAGARAALERALAGGARSVRLLAMKAEIELAAGDANAAATTLRGAVALEPSDAMLWVTLAGALRRAGQAAEARTAADQALLLDSSSATALLVLAELSIDGGDVVGANAAIARAEATGRAPAAELARARVHVLVAMGVGAAGVAAADAIARASRDASLYVALGRLHAQAEQDREAADAFAHAVRLDARDVEAWIGKVFLAMRRGDLRGASRGIDKASSLAEARGAGPALRARIEAARGRLRFETGNFGDARVRAEAALALDARCAEAHLLLANIAIEQAADPMPALRASVAGIAPPAEAIGRLALRLPRGAEACATARRYLEAAPRGYDADAVREVADHCR